MQRCIVHTKLVHDQELVCQRQVGDFVGLHCNVSNCKFSSFKFCTLLHCKSFQSEVYTFTVILLLNFYIQSYRIYSNVMRGATFQSREMNVKKKVSLSIKKLQFGNESSSLIIVSSEEEAKVSLGGIFKRPLSKQFHFHKILHDSAPNTFTIVFLTLYQERYRLYTQRGSVPRQARSRESRTISESDHPRIKSSSMLSSLSEIELFFKKNHTTISFGRPYQAMTRSTEPFRSASHLNRAFTNCGLIDIEPPSCGRVSLLLGHTNCQFLEAGVILNVL